VAWVAALALLLYSYGHRGGTGVLASSPDRDPQTSASSIITPPQSRPETAIVPVGTRIQIRLEQAISLQRSFPGDHLSAALYGPIWVDGKFLAPSRSKVITQLTKMDSGSANGRAGLVIVLQELILNGQKYRLEAQPLMLEASAVGNEDGATGVATNSAAPTDGSESEFSFVLTAPLELPVIKKVRQKQSPTIP
jgi:hypothetical protein